jgi:anti-anti-sigma factor
MTITTTENNGLTEVHVKGRLDAITSNEFFEKICAIATSGHVNIAVDASEVDYISSAGMRSLLQSQRKLSQLGGSFHIAKASPFVLQTLSMSGLDSLLAAK